MSSQYPLMSLMPISNQRRLYDIRAVYDIRSGSSWRAWEPLQNLDSTSVDLKPSI